MKFECHKDQLEEVNKEKQQIYEPTITYFIKGKGVPITGHEGP